jgi:hypothetical protein
LLFHKNLQMLTNVMHIIMLHKGKLDKLACIM